jgi:hypothetical protein
MKSGARRQNHRALWERGLAGADASAAWIRFAALGAQRAAAEATVEPIEARAIFGRDGPFSRGCVTICRRLAAPRGFRSPADASPLGG